MSKIMKTTSLTALLSRAAGEFKAKASIYGIPESLFREMFALEAESPGLIVMSGRASLPVGPAAGPHTQIAPNILAAYLSGARVFELKTVQKERQARNRKTLHRRPGRRTQCRMVHRAEPG